jgi:hypothetical protein
MVVKPVITSLRSARSDTGLNARLYELASTRPMPLLEIPVTLTLLAFGPKVNAALIHAYSSRRHFLTRLSNTARLVAVTSWFLPAPISRALVFPLMLCALPKLVTTLLLLSAPILRMLMVQYEFWFTTVLNTMGMVLFAIQIGPDIRLGYPFITFMSIQVTICSDADVYTLSETARAGVLSSVCAIALGLFALHQSVFYKAQPPSSSRDWNLAQVNFMANVSLTLAIFIINKSYKRRHVFPQQARPVVPLAVCRAKLTVRSKRLIKSPGVPTNASIGDVQTSDSSARNADQNDSPGASSEDSSGDSSRDVVLESGKLLHFRVVAPVRCIVDANHTLVPSLCRKRRLSQTAFALLTLCGAVGLISAMVSIVLIVLSDNHNRAALNACGVLSFVCTSLYVLFFASHYQRDLLVLLLHNFDFWFTTLQFVTATICLADLIDWDFRSLNLLAWSLWFLWSVFTDALLPTHKRKLRFKKCHATLAMIAIIFAILVITYGLLLDNRNILHSRVLNVGTLGGFFTIVVSTRTFMCYRLATIMLWTCRLAWRLGLRPEDEFVLLRGAVEYQNPFFHQAYSRGSQLRNPPEGYQKD